MDANEVEKLIDAFGTDVYRFCVKLARNKFDSDDLYQLTFMRLLNGKVKINWDNNPKALLFSVAYHVFKDQQRKLARRHRIAPSFTIDEQMESFTAGEQDIEADLISQELQQLLNEIIEGLPENFRMIVVLYYQFDVAIAEIAKIVKIPGGTVKSRLAKARALIKKELEANGYGKT